MPQASTEAETLWEGGERVVSHKSGDLHEMTKQQAGEAFVSAVLMYRKSEL